MAIVNLNTTTQTALLNAIKAAIDAGSGPGTVELYNGTMPATPATAVTTQTKLGTLTFSDPCGSVSGNLLTMSAITQDSSADATGTASWARIKDSDGVVVEDIDVTSSGGGGVLQMNTTNIVIGGPILITAFEHYIG